MTRLKQTSRNIVDVVRGAYHGSIASLYGLAKGAEDNLIKVASLGNAEADFSEFNKQLSRIPRNRYGVAGAVTASLCTLTLCSTLLFQGMKRGADFWFSMGEEQPRIVYFVDGREVTTKTFKTNEEMHKYAESEQGKREAEYYRNLNRKPVEAQ